MLLYTTLFLSQEGKQTKFTTIVAYLDGVTIASKWGRLSELLYSFLHPKVGTD